MFGPFGGTLASKMEQPDSSQGGKKAVSASKPPKKSPNGPQRPPKRPPKAPKMVPKGSKNDPQASKNEASGCCRLLCSLARPIVRPVLGRAGGMRLWRIRRPSGVGVPSHREAGPTLGPTLGVMSLDAPAQFFRVFVVFVPLQKSSPAPANPTSPPLKATSEFLLSVQKRLPKMTSFFSVWGRFGSVFAVPNGANIGPKSVKSLSKTDPGFQLRFLMDLWPLWSPKWSPRTPMLIENSCISVYFSENALFRYEVRFVTTLVPLWLHFGDQNGIQMVPGTSKVTFKS